MSQEKLNIIYFVCHDLGKHLGCYDTPVKSPNLDAFAEGGVKFTRTFCNAPACSPSRACAMTGQYSHTNGEIGLSHMGWSLRQDKKTVVDYFNDAGYETAHFGLNHERHGGTNHYQIDEEKHWDDWDASNAVDKTIEYLKTKDNSAQEKPFYLNVGTGEVHGSRWNGSLDLYGGPVPEDEVYIPNYIPNAPKEMRQALAKFQAAIRYMDIHFARLIKAIDELGYRDNTIVIFTTDHGIHTGNRSKGTLYERGVEISLLMRLPTGMASGVTVNELMQNIDIAPTILDAAGVDIPSDIQGRSFWPLLTGGEYKPHEQIFMERNFHGEKPFYGAEKYADIYDPIRAVRTNEFHYIRNYDAENQKNEWRPFDSGAKLNDEPGLKFEKIWPEKTQPRPAEELYHISHDPGEFFNLVDQPEYASVKADLSARLDKWMKDTDDHILTGEIPTRPDEPGWGEHWPIEER